MRASDRPKPKLPAPLTRWPWGLSLSGLVLVLQALWAHPWSDGRVQQVGYSRLKELIAEGRISRTIPTEVYPPPSGEAHGEVIQSRPV